MVKADAYGHGAVRVARTVLNNGASYLGVASVNEGAALRQAGIAAPILILGFVPAWQAREVVLHDLAAYHEQRGEYGEAERLLRQAMAMDHNYPAPHYNLRRIYMEQGRWEEALSISKKGLTLMREMGDRRGEGRLARHVQQEADVVEAAGRLRLRRLKLGTFSSSCCSAICRW